MLQQHYGKDAKSFHFSRSYSRTPTSIVVSSVAMVHVRGYFDREETIQVDKQTNRRTTTIDHIVCGAV